MDQTQNEVVENEEKEVNDQADEFYGKEPEGDDTTEVGPDDTTESEEPAKTEESDTDKGEEKETEETKDKEEESKEEGVLTKEDLKLSDNTSLKDKDLDSVLETAKKLGLNKEQAQSYLEMQEESLRSYEEKIEGDLKEIGNTWLEELKSHPTLGGENFKKTQELSEKGMRAFFNDEAIQVLKDSNLINNKAFVEGFAKIGRDVSEETRVVGSPATPAKTNESPEDIFYGN